MTRYICLYSVGLDRVFVFVEIFHRLHVRVILDQWGPCWGTGLKLMARVPRSEATILFFMFVLGCYNIGPPYCPILCYKIGNSTSSRNEFCTVFSWGYENPHVILRFLHRNVTDCSLYGGDCCLWNVVNNFVSSDARNGVSFSREFRDFANCFVVFLL